MESGLLNAFHDDQYDGNNYMKYELDSNYWSNENNGTLGIQLSETLNGILPIAPNEEKLQYFNDADDELNFQYSVEVGHTNINNSHAYDNETFSIIDENIHSSSSLIEVIPIDPNIEYCYSPLNLQSNDIENDDDGEDSEEDSISITSKSSGLTFRSRTDSSSIGDYESHSSDENSDCENYCDMIINQPIICDETNNKILVNHQSKKNVINDKVENVYNLVNPKIIKKTKYFLTKEFISDESDIDIETISENKIQEIIGTGSNKNNDINETIQVPKKYPTRNIQKIQNNKEILPKKIASDKKFVSNNKERIPEKITTTKNKKSPLKILNKKLLQAGLRVTNIANLKTKNKIDENKKSICSKNNNKLQNELDAKQIITNNKEIKLVENSIENDVKVNNIESRNDVSIEIKQPIKRKLNLEEYKRRRNGILGPSLCIDNNSSDSTSSFLTNSTNSSNSTITSTSNNSKDLQSIEINAPNIILNNNPQQKQILIQKNIMPPNPNSLLKKSFYYMAANQEKPMDPITEAKNKVLRIQEMKRKAVQKRLIDVSAKVGPVTKILPLEEIVKNSNNQINTNQIKLNSEYEEIIIVSIGCNTDLHIPPINKRSSDDTKSTSALLVISDTLEKVKTSSEQFKISNQSLITSIQNVVFQKSVVGNTTLESSSTSVKNTDEKIEHGEDKIIMHLRKNRIRAQKFSTLVQTDFLPEFPPLELLSKEYGNTLSKKERLNLRKYRLQKNSCTENDSENYADHNYCGNSTNKTSSIDRSDSESEIDDCERKSSYDSNSKHNSRKKSTSSEYSDGKRSWSRSKSRWMEGRSRRNSYSRSRSRSASRSRTRSRSRSRSYSRRNTSKNNTRKNNRKQSPAVEERRIVYVGRIEDETTRDDLRNKFIAYGPIKQITLHYKDTGMKYGFVTYDKAGDAFKAIDNSANDENIKMYDISFGGRRGFCRSIYSDLDGAATNYYPEYSYGNQYQDQYNIPKNTKKDEDDSFEALLQKVKKKIVNTKQNQQPENSNNNYRNKNNK